MSKNKNTVLIIEDDVVFSLKLEMSLTNWGYEVVGIYKSGEEALNAVYVKEPDIILMDINLEGNLTGIEVANKIMHLKADIIFMTAWENDDFFEKAKNKTAGISYLVKPFNLLTLKGVLEMSRKEEKSNSTILLRRGQETVPINIDEIIWIKADGNYCDIYTEEGRFILKKSIIKFLEELETDKIVKIHRQHAASIDRIRKVWISKGELELKNGMILPIGRTYKKRLIEEIKKR